MRSTATPGAGPIPWRAVAPTIAPSSTRRTATPDEIDYRLARQSLISEYRKRPPRPTRGLRRAPGATAHAKALGSRTARPCPICAESELVLVTYVFGPRLPAGRCIIKSDELTAIAKRSGPSPVTSSRCAPSCWWNHLMRSFLLGRGVTEWQGHRLGRRSSRGALVASSVGPWHPGARPVTRRTPPSASPPQPRPPGQDRRIAALVALALPPIPVLRRCHRGGERNRRVVGRIQGAGPDHQPRARPDLVHLHRQRSPTTATSRTPSRRCTAR